jgi:hypothetical protein
LDLKLGPAIKLCHQIERVKIAFYEQWTWFRVLNNISVAMTYQNVIIIWTWWSTCTILLFWLPRTHECWKGRL